MSKLIPVFYGVIKEGKPRIKNKELYFDWCQHFKEDSEIEIIVREIKKKRSNPQNRYYHGVVLKLISGKTGYTPEEIHDILKYQFLKEETPIGITTRSTASLNSEEFGTYLDQCITWARETISLTIPLPNEVDY